jgi:hypothetical protein
MRNAHALRRVSNLVQIRKFGLVRFSVSVSCSARAMAGVGRRGPRRSLKPLAMSSPSSAASASAAAAADWRSAHTIPDAAVDAAYLAGAARAVAAKVASNGGGPRGSVTVAATQFAVDSWDAGTDLCSARNAQKAHETETFLIS